jgi:hypothetical protein
LLHSSIPNRCIQDKRIGNATSTRKPTVYANLKQAKSVTDLTKGATISLWTTAPEPIFRHPGSQLTCTQIIRLTNQQTTHNGNRPSVTVLALGLLHPGTMMIDEWDGCWVLKECMRHGASEMTVQTTRTGVTILNANNNDFGRPTNQKSSRTLGGNRCV